MPTITISLQTMEKDIDHIVEVDPEEAKILIDLIETLIDDWYIEHHKRTERFAKAKALADKKEGERAKPTASE